MDDEPKAQIIAESYVPGVTVCTVARRLELTLQQLFTWRRLARKPLEAAPDLDSVSIFAPGVLHVPTKPAMKEPEPARGSMKKPVRGEIELEIGGTTARIASGADIAAVVQAVKATS